MLYVGDDRAAAVDGLMAAFDAVAAGDGPRAVCLSSETGLGKTRVVHEFYARLASQRQAQVPYWPPSIGGAEELQLLEDRKRVNPPWLGTPGTAVMPWFWWGMECQRTQSGSNMAALLTARSHFEAHGGQIRDRIEARKAHRDFAMQCLGSVADVVGVVVPGVATGKHLVLQGAGVFARWRSLRRPRAKDDVVVGLSGFELEESGKLADALVGISASDLPVILFVDDAHAADFALVNFLRRVLATEQSAVLIVATAWTHALRVQGAGGDFRTFGQWWHTVANDSNTTEIVLPKLGSDDMSRLVLDVAPRTSPEIVEGLLEVAGGNPLVLRLILGLDAVRRDAADGSIDVAPAALERLPRDVKAIFGDLFRQLPPDIQRALALLSLQGPVFDPMFLDDVADELRMFGVVDALRSAGDAYGWIHSAPGDLGEFAERARYDVAFDSNSELFAEDELDKVRRRIIEAVLTRRVASGWLDTPLETRRLLLSQLMDAAVPSGAFDLATRADIAGELSDLSVALGDRVAGVDFARQAVRILEETDAIETSQGVRARRRLAVTLTDTGQAPEALGEMGAALATAETLDDDTQLETTLEDFHDLVEISEGLDTAEIARSEPLHLAEYAEWEPRPVPELTSLAPAEIAPLLAEIVEVEGPVVAERAYQLLRTASGASRLGRQIKIALDRGVTSALRRGLLGASMWEEDTLRRTLDRRYPIELVPRRLGNRDIEQVPIEEIVAALRALNAADPSLDGDSLKRALLHEYSWSRLTARADAHITRAIRTATRPSARRTIDEVLARADRCGVREELEAWVGLIGEAGWQIHAWTASLTAAFPGDRSRTLLHIAPQPTGVLKVRIEPTAFPDPSDATAIDGLGVSAWTNLGPEASRSLRQRLQEVLGSLSKSAGTS